MATLCRILLLLSCCLTAAMHCGALTHRALVIGLGQQEDSNWVKINGDNDVRYITDLLKRLRYTDITTLTNNEATKAGIVDEFKKLAARCNKGDIVYIHYSGHGQLITDLDGDEAMRWDGGHSLWDESWIPYDAYMYYCDNDHGEKHLTDDEVYDLLMAIRHKIGDKGQLVVSVDSCHSGDATCGTDEAIRGVSVKFNLPIENVPDPVVRRSDAWLTISACRPYQLSAEIKDLNVGRLTYALYKLGRRALSAENADMEKMLSDFVGQYATRVRQNPMVTGRR